VVGTADTLSTFGEIVVLILIQVGGIGFMILSVVLLRLIGRRVALEERIILRQILGVKTSHGVVQLALSVTLVTLGIELVGAAILFLTWWDEMGPVQAAYYATFHSVSAFCNAGFDLFGGASDPWLLATRRDPVAIFTMSVLIIIGTLGITVIFDLLTFPRTKRLSLHSKLIIPLAIFLTLAGTFLLLLDEALFSDALSAMPRGERWLTAFFTVVSSRTAGITIVPIQGLGQASQLLLMMFMFIGGAPASMGGGIGMTTVAVVLVTLYNNVRGHPDVRVFQRTLPTETVFKAAAIITVSTTLVFCVTLAILLVDGGDLVTVTFEVISAFSNTGYSLGITNDLNQISRLLIVFTMFWGRLGPLTLVVALARRRRQTQISYPEERIIIG
jgi:trk system potassium uptake protein TrkH